MRKFLKGLGKILARMFRKFRSGVAGIARFADGLVSGIFGGGGYDSDDEDDLIEVANDNEAREAIAGTPVAPSAPCLGLLAKRAGECRDGGRPIGGLFDLRDPEQRRVHDFVAALDESGLRALRSMPQGTVARHLDRQYPLRAVGLPDVDKALAQARAADLARKPAAKMTAREAASELMRQARAEGRKPNIGEIVAASRGRA